MDGCHACSGAVYTAHLTVTHNRPYVKRCLHLMTTCMLRANTRRLRTVFERELELYGSAAMEGILPAVLAIRRNGDGAAATSFGFAWPPFIVVERCAPAVCAMHHSAETLG